jgi:thiamine pyrophosphokinase
MKCIQFVTELEGTALGRGGQLGVILLGGLGGRVDQTVHMMSMLHKLRKTREYTFVLTEENIAWTLDSVRES